MFNKIQKNINTNIIYNNLISENEDDIIFKIVSYIKITSRHKTTSKIYLDNHYFIYFEHSK